MDIHDKIIKWISETIETNVGTFLVGEPEEWNFMSLKSYYNGWLVNEKCPLTYTDDELKGLTPSDVANTLIDRAMEIYHGYEELLTEDTMREIERVYLLRSVDTFWMEHLDAMEELKHSIRMRAYAQHDPVVEYTHEGFSMFDEMIETIRQETVKLILIVPGRIHQIKKRQEEEERARKEAEKAAAAAHQVILGKSQEKEKANPITLAIKREQVAKPIEWSGDGTTSTNRTVKKSNKVGRNDPCPCGSGKKYKKCCGMNE